MTITSTILLVCILACAGGCGARLAGTPGEATGVTDQGQNIEFLYFDGCPNHIELRKRLSVALPGSDGVAGYREIDMISLADNDPRLRWGSPTILVDGVDLFDQAPSETPSLTCRFYPSGLPSVEVLEARLQGLD